MKASVALSAASTLCVGFVALPVACRVPFWSIVKVMALHIIQLSSRRGGSGYVADPGASRDPN